MAREGFEDSIFVDASAFVALHNEKDPHHARARVLTEAYVDNGQVCVTSNYVIAESVTMISQRAAHALAVLFYEEVFQKFFVIRASPFLEQQAFSIFKSLTSKNVSFVDCTSFALMREYGIATAFAFDEDFKKQGFRLLTE